MRSRKRFLFLILLLQTLIFIRAHASQDLVGQWWKSTSIYQVYPRSFKDTNGDGIGDLRGVISKLDYLKGLGVETIWLSPFFESPQKDFGYDISNYREIAKEFGTQADVDDLIREVHLRGMKILFDMVMNHTSDQHPWFLESSQSRTNPKSDWYIWRDQPTNWLSAIGKPGWHYHKGRKQWYFASFLSFQPDLNYRNPEVKKAMLDNVRYWLDRGVDGFRLDIFNVIYKDAQFRNNPKSWNPFPNDERVNFQIKKYTANLPESYEFARELRAVVNEYHHPERMLVGEVMGSHPKIKPYLGEKQDGLNMIFLFDILKFKFNASFFREKLNLYEKEYPAPYVPTYVFSNHDQIRSMSRLGGNHEKAKLLSILQFTARGVPVMYQGEEIGMSNTNLAGVTPLDPIAYVYTKIPEFIVKWMKILVNRDVVRTPFQWDDSHQAGFCDLSCKPWLPVSKNASVLNLAAQEREPASVHNQFKNIIALRNSLEVFKTGKIKIYSSSEFPKDLLVYDRYLEGGERARVILNFGKKTQNVTLPRSKLLYSSQNQNKMYGDRLKLNGLSGVVVILE